MDTEEKVKEVPRPEAACGLLRANCGEFRIEEAAIQHDFKLYFRDIELSRDPNIKKVRQEMRQFGYLLTAKIEPADEYGYVPGAAGEMIEAHITGVLPQRLVVEIKGTTILLPKTHVFLQVKENVKQLRLLNHMRNKMAEFEKKMYSCLGELKSFAEIEEKEAVLVED